eukprot:Amastigsp_a515657_20.p7 type:complete len:106 gc:universal Amastigsp_a515657_20:633-316(-)
MRPWASNRAMRCAARRRGASSPAGGGTKWFLMTSPSGVSCETLESRTRSTSEPSAVMAIESRSSLPLADSSARCSAPIEPSADSWSRSTRVNSPRRMSCTEMTPT